MLARRLNNPTPPRPFCQKLPDITQPMLPYLYDQVPLDSSLLLKNFAACVKAYHPSDTEKKVYNSNFCHIVSIDLSQYIIQAGKSHSTNFFGVSPSGVCPRRETAKQEAFAPRPEFLVLYCRHEPRRSDLPTEAGRARHLVRASRRHPQRRGGGSPEARARPRTPERQVDRRTPATAGGLTRRRHPQRTPAALLSLGGRE